MYYPLNVFADNPKFQIIVGEPEYNSKTEVFKIEIVIILDSYQSSPHPLFKPIKIPNHIHLYTEHNSQINVKTYTISGYITESNPDNIQRKVEETVEEIHKMLTDNVSKNRKVTQKLPKNIAKIYKYTL